jgi:PAS domain S-box-containing protein
LRKDGSKFWISISWHPVIDANGFSAGFRTSAQDITERKLAEESLIESEHILRESQAIARLGSFEWDIKSGFWKSSEILDKIFGIDKQFIRSLEGWTSIVHPEWRNYMSDYAVNEVVGQHKNFDKEYKILRKDDQQERWVHGLAELEFNSNNEPVKLVGTISDISGRKQAEFELKASEENYRTLFEKMSQGVFYQMADGSISAVNDAALHMFGLSREQMMGRTSYDPGWHVTDESGALLPPEKHPSMIALITGLPCDNRIVGVYNPQQQQFRWLDVNAIPQFDAGDTKPRKVFVTLHDITDRKEAEEALMQKMNELERFNDLTVGRELKMIELKKEINVLLTRSGEKEKYKIVT